MSSKGKKGGKKGPVEEEELIPQQKKPEKKKGKGKGDDDDVEDLLPVKKGGKKAPVEEEEPAVSKKKSGKSSEEPKKKKGGNDDNEDEEVTTAQMAAVSISKKKKKPAVVREGADDDDENGAEEAPAEDVGDAAAADAGDTEEGAAADDAGAGSARKGKVSRKTAKAQAAAEKRKAKVTKKKKGRGADSDEEATEEQQTEAKQDYPWYVELKGRNRTKNRDVLIDNLSITLNGQVLLKEGTKLHLIYGKKYGMVGRNGLGKSVMLRRISSRAPELGVPEFLKILHVEQEVQGDDTTPLVSVLQADQEREWLLKEAARMEGLKAKEKESGQLNEAEEDERSYTLADVYERLRDIDSDTAESRASSILAGLGFLSEDIRTKPTKHYSGGWRMRISLARALFSQPDLLLLDEPNNHLDLEACIWLEGYLADWKKTLLVVSHDPAFLNEFVDNIVHLHAKTFTQYKGDYDSFLKQREMHRRAKAKRAGAIEREEKNLREQAQRMGDKAGRMRRDRLAKLEHIELDVDDPTMKFSFPESGGLGPLPLKFKEVSFGYDPAKPIFRNLDFGIDTDSRVALVGRNGVGKSTLMNLMAGNLEPTRGEVDRDRHMRVARFHQHHVDQLDLSMTVMGYMQKVFPDSKEQEVRQHLAKFGLVNRTPYQKIETLSGGQKSRVVFAELVWRRPHLLFLDEPTNHLDLETIESLAAALADFDGGVVLITHNQYLVELACTEIWIVGNNTVTRFEGTFSDYKKLVAKELGFQSV